MPHEKPYHNLYNIEPNYLIINKILQALHGCLQLMSWDNGLILLINGSPCFIYFFKKNKAVRQYIGYDNRDQDKSSWP